MRRILAALLAFGAIAGTVRAAVPNLKWEREFPGTEYGSGRHVVAFDSKQNIVVIGTDQSGPPCMAVTKIEPGGGEIWRKAFCGNPGFAQAVAVDGSDNVYITGSIDTYTPEAAARTLKLAPDGGVIWDARLATPGTLPIGGVRVAPDRNGNAYIATDDLQARAITIAKYDTAGRIAWTSAVQPFEYIVLAVHASGDLFVAGTRWLGGARSWSVSRLRASDGREAWHVDEVQAGGIATAVTVDSRGDLIVTGSRNYPAKRIMKTVKYGGDTGARVWTRELETAGDTRALDIAVWANDDIVVTGSDDHFKTVKYRSDGTKVWEASYSGMNGVDAANGLAIDRNGDVLVTGYLNYFVGSNGSNWDSDMRTVKYSGSDGSLLWSVGYDAPVAYPSIDFGQVVRDVGDGVISLTATWNGPARVAKYGYAVAPLASAQGLWWNAAESGWGLNIAHHGDKLFATWFTYDEARKPTWWVMPNVQNKQGNEYAGFAYRMRGAAFSSTPFASAQVAPVESKQVWISFADDMSRASVSFREVPFTMQLTRFQFAAPFPDCRQDATAAGGVNYQDLWWNPAESGWGLNLAHQGDIVFATWFTYDEAGTATWFVASGLRLQPDGSFSGSLEQVTSGSPAFSPWNPAAFAQKNVGSATVSFSDPDHGVFRYVVNGVSQQKPITRMVFALPATRCH